MVPELYAFVTNLSGCEICQTNKNTLPPISSCHLVTDSLYESLLLCFSICNLYLPFFIYFSSNWSFDLLDETGSGCWLQTNPAPADSQSAVSQSNIKWSKLAGFVIKPHDLNNSQTSKWGSHLGVARLRAWRCGSHSRTARLSGQVGVGCTYINSVRWLSLCIFHTAKFNTVLSHI